MRKYLIFNLIEFFLWGYTSYWDMTFNYKTNLSIQDSIFHSCTFIPLLRFIKVKNIKNTSFKNPQESATSLFYLLTHKYLLQNNLQIPLVFPVCGACASVRNGIFFRGEWYLRFSRKNNRKTETTYGCFSYIRDVKPEWLKAVML